MTKRDEMRRDEMSGRCRCSGRAARRASASHRPGASPRLSIPWHILICPSLCPSARACYPASFSDILINHTDGYTTAIARSSNLKETLQQQQQSQAQAADDQTAAGPAQEQ